MNDCTTLILLHATQGSYCGSKIPHKLVSKTTFALLLVSLLKVDVVCLCYAM